MDYPTDYTKDTKSPAVMEDDAKKLFLKCISNFTQVYCDRYEQMVHEWRKTKKSLYPGSHPPTLPILEPARVVKFKTEKVTRTGEEKFRICTTIQCGYQSNDDEFDIGPLGKMSLKREFIFSTYEQWILNHTTCLYPGVCDVCGEKAGFPTFYSDKPNDYKNTHHMLLCEEHNKKLCSARPNQTGGFIDGWSWDHLCYTFDPSFKNWMEYCTDNQRFLTQEELEEIKRKTKDES